MTRRGVLCRLRNGERFLVDKDPFTVGRAKHCDLAIPRGMISRRHLTFVKRNDRWWAVDPGSTSGIDIGGSRMTGPTALEVGLAFRLGDDSIEVVDLDYEAKPGELLPGVDRELRLRCAGLLCHATAWFRSVTGNTALNTTLDELVRATGAAITGSDLLFTEPGELVFALQRLEESVGVYNTLDPQQRDSIELELRQRDLIIGSAALELLVEPSVPARAAWRWLTHRDRPHLDPSLVRGIAIRMDHLRQESIREELLGACELPGPGLCAWVWDAMDGYLYWIPKRGVIVSRNRANEVVDVLIAREPSGWVARYDGIDQQLAVGAHLTVGYAHEIQVVGIT